MSLILQPYLRTLANYNINAQDALLITPSNWVYWLGQYGNQGIAPFQPLRHLPCCSCESPLCEAWIAFHCGGCNRVFWTEQKLIYRLWCGECQGNDLRQDDWGLAFERESGVRYTQARRVYEAPEQLILAWARWTVKGWIHRCQKLVNSHILAARCKYKVPHLACFYRAYLGPIWEDPDTALDRCIAKVQRLYVGKASPKHNNKRKGN